MLRPGYRHRAYAIACARPPQTKTLGVRPVAAIRSTIPLMQVVTGTVVDGKVIIEGVSLQEGALVAVLARGADEPFRLTAAEEDELLAAMAEIERGEFITLEQLLESLPK